MFVLEMVHLIALYFCCCVHGDYYNKYILILFNFQIKYKWQNDSGMQFESIYKLWWWKWWWILQCWCIERLKMLISLEVMACMNIYCMIFVLSISVIKSVCHLTLEASISSATSHNMTKQMWIQQQKEVAALLNHCLRSRHTVSSVSDCRSWREKKIKVVILDTCELMNGATRSSLECYQQLVICMELMPSNIRTACHHLEQTSVLLGVKLMLL